MLSVIIPAYNETETISRTTEVILDILHNADIDHELIYVDDGSTDSTWEQIDVMSKQHSGVRGISFSRNFGKESAIYAGLVECLGDCAVVIDCDLQHPPEKIVDMYRLWEDGYEIVEGIKSDRGREGILHRAAAGAFYRIISNATGQDMSGASDYKLLDRKAVNALINMKEKNSFFRALSSWVGFKSTQIEYDVRSRTQGESKWSTGSLVRYALTNITSFTNIPLQIVTFLGAAMFVLGAFLSIQALYKWIAGIALGGFTTVIILQCFSSSIIMISLGIVGYYLSRIYDEIKGRPKYIVSERVGFDEVKK